LTAYRADRINRYGDNEMKDKIEKLFYTINELSQLLSISSAGIRSKIYRGEIPKLKIMGRVMIPVQWVNKIIQIAYKKSDTISEDYEGRVSS
jgi:hypothetical protein